MTIRPWFLATLSLGFVAALLLVRGEFRLSTGNRTLDDALDPNHASRKRAAGRKILGHVKEKVLRPAPKVNLTVAGLSDQVEGVVRKTTAKVSAARRSPRKTKVV
jgi:hypothetical protein